MTNEQKKFSVMKKFVLFLFIIALVSACKKEVTHPVIYKVVVSTGHPTYSVQYLSGSNTTVSQGPFSSGMWVSDKIEKEAGSTALLTLTGGTGGSYKLYIYVDGTLYMEGRMDDPYGPETISVVVPQ